MLAAAGLVLVQPRNADNLAAIARAMRAFAVVDWVAVSTEQHLVGMREVLARHRAPGQTSALVQTLRRVDTLAEAIADCSWVVGTTMRAIEDRPRFTPRQLATEAAQRHDTTWALVFGAECNGLQNAEVSQCHAVSYIPTHAEQPSLNLAQAVLVYAHELALVRTAGTEAVDGSGRPPLADDATLRELERALIASLVAAGYLHDAKADRRVIDALMSSLRRASLTVEESANWRHLLATHEP